MTDQHVQPVQSLAPDRSGSGRRTTFAVIAPLAILFIVAGAGVLGRAGAPLSALDGPAPDYALERPTESTPSPSPRRAPSRVVEVAFPSTALGLQVEPVQEVAGRLRRGAPGPSVVAVSGWLTIHPVPDACRIDAVGSPPAALCPRETLLAWAPDPVLEVGAGGDVSRIRPSGPHVHAVALPGVSLRYLAGRQYTGLATVLTPLPVVVVGRVDDPRLPACRPSGRHCGESFALERVVWVDGETLDLGTVGTLRPVPPAGMSASERADRVRAAVPGAAEILSELRVPRAELGRVDRAAAGSVDASIEGPVWYVRYLVAGPGGAGDVGWAVLDAASGAVVAVPEHAMPLRATPQPLNLP
jgi:hypothetical protein